MNEDKKIIGVFHTHDEAVRAIETLKNKGYRSEDISVIAKDRDRMESIEEETDTKLEEGLAAGATTGGVLGGLAGLLVGIGALAIPGVGPIVAAGPIAATLGGAVVGAGAGGLVGALVGMGIPEDEAKEYEEYLNQGEILVMVDADAEREHHVYDTFRNNNALNSHMYDPYLNDASVQRRNNDSLL
ncbi:general stress protein [Aneurinibacillus migulanus]|uniref:Heat induced stress protein YflT n=1 Tax=Aneurinibacillus migulanus TaxID=47500 RepID=A0A0D1W0T7_ANEMI|nr:general stress protein [Aneurinibacillus migulanus]KIV52055.1 low temperature-induced protein [Aneurinibacillus migulanus]KON98192.1 low temperature-induced protein [Aneurinibacillus migulanus]MED0891488.1 general stress protein [Aneurinibacillus migulanus]MED1613823.1 general stress protein [Aneurinibacillus migulanus]SDI07742.1 Heat induced stress protein YflT [Aneurinibacillus migulanus]